MCVCVTLIIFSHFTTASPPSCSNTGYFQLVIAEMGLCRFVTSINQRLKKNTKRQPFVLYAVHSPWN